MFHRRSGGSAPRHLIWRVRLLGLGAVLALLGIGTRLDWVINVAIGVLIVGFGLRFLGGAHGGEEGMDDDELEDAQGDGPAGDGPPPGPRS